MSLRYLLGPVPADWVWRWQPERAARHCRAFNDRGDLDLTVGPGDSWDDVCRKLPGGWKPDFLVLNLNYTSVPRGLWSAPVLAFVNNHFAGYAPETVRHLAALAG